MCREMTKHYGVGEVDCQQRANNIFEKYGRSDLESKVDSSNEGP